MYASTLALAKMAEARDEDTGDHLERMKRYTLLLAQVLRDDGLHAEVLTPEYLHALERFSPMHDIGKVGIRDNVLLKPGRLTETEYEHMKTHAVYGAAVLGEAENNVARSGRTLFRFGIEIAGNHHERWDGAGYPNGLRGPLIPLSARIVSLADVLDALTTRRPYKEPYSFERSVGMIRESSGSQFDPEIIDCFLRHQDRFRDLYRYFQNTQSASY